MRLLLRLVRLATPLAFALAVSCATLPPPMPASPSHPKPSHTTPPPPPVVTPLSGPLRLEGEPALEVGLAWDLDSIAIQPAHASVPWRIERLPGEVIANGVGAGFRLRRAGRSFQGGDGGPAALAPGDTLWIGGAGCDTARTFRWSGRTWRGCGKVFIGPRGGLTLALRLPLEGYLLGVVPGEIGALADNLLEAGRAQAIAARSYTLYYRGRRGAEGFDLYGNVEDQVYGAIESERPLATRCVTTTRGLFAMSDGQPIRANYYSTCGGISADVWEGWPAQRFTYLKGRRDVAAGVEMCAASPVFRWREEWRADTLLSRLAKYGPAEGLSMPRPGPGALIDVRVAARSRSGRVWRLEIETTAGVFAVPAYSIRRVLRRTAAGEPILRSNLFKIDVRRDPRTHLPIAVVASGAGFGHGVGLCQTGALGMARAGHKGEAILEHYYPGAVLKPLYR